MILDLETSCIDQGLANILGIVGNIINIISIVIPILLIISLIVTFIKLLKNPDEKKHIKRISISIIATIMIFFIPTFINVSLNLAGEKYNFSSCWLLAKENRISLSSPKYIDINNGEKKNVLVDSDKYEKGKPKKKSAYSSATLSGAGAKLVAAARTQIGMPYNSMHYGPREGDGLGFGCAMFVSYCYNQVFFGGVSGQSRGLGGFYGSTWEYWGNVTNDGYDAYNKKFVEVTPSQAQAGDVVAFLRGGNHYSSAQNCYHVGLYVGDGRIIDSSYSGVSERSVNINNGELHFLRYVGPG